MDNNRFPNDPWIPFFGTKSLPCPETYEGESIVTTGFNVERCKVLHHSKGLITVNRFHPTFFHFKKAQDGAGNWVWTFPKSFGQIRPDLN